jgi:hypothetical protein
MEGNGSDPAVPSGSIRGGISSTVRQKRIESDSGVLRQGADIHHIFFSEILLANERNTQIGQNKTLFGLEEDPGNACFPVKMSTYSLRSPSFWK